MNNSSNNKPLQGTPGAAVDGERRRIGTVVHDDRGNASVEWQDAPTDYRRPVLEIAGEAKLTLKNEESYDPYAHRATRTAPRSATTRTDLRKLSEWIKMMRELEERKRRGEDGGDGGDGEAG